MLQVEEIVFLREKPRLLILYHVVSSEMLYIQLIIYGPDKVVFIYLGIYCVLYRLHV